jgi:hypothetical protein
MVALPRLQAGRRALKQELSTGNDREMRRDLFDFGEQVTGKKTGNRAPPRQVADEPPHLVNARRIEAIGRLVNRGYLANRPQSRAAVSSRSNSAVPPVVHTQQIHHIEPPRRFRAAAIRATVYALRDSRAKPRCRHGCSRRAP